jgi:hypothetical protein
MSDNILSAPVISQGGYDSTQNHLNLDFNYPGRASRLVNYEVGLTGGYREISGFVPLNTDFPEVDEAGAEGKILGLAIYQNSLGAFTIMAARKQQSGATYNWYYNDPVLGWTAFTTGLTLSSAGVDKIRHAKVNFGGVSYIIFADGTNKATVYDGTDWYALDSTGTGTDVDPGGDQLIDAPSVVTIYKNHVFLSGDVNAPSIVVHSAPEDVFDWTAAGGAGQIPVGFIVNQIKPFRDTLYIFGINNISSVAVSGANFVLSSVTSDMGCLAPDSVIEVNADLLFIAPDGIRPISGTERIGDIEIATISKPIQNFTRNLIRQYPLELMSAVVIREKSQFRYFISQGNGVDEGSGIIGGLRSNEQGLGWEFSELMGITASVCESDFIDGFEVVLHGGFDGCVYQQEVGYSFNGQDITSIYSTPYLTFGDSENRKNLRYLNTFYRSEGEFDVTVSLDFDWGLSGVLEPQSYSQSASPVLEGQTVGIYDAGNDYDSGIVYGGSILSPVVKTSINGTCFSVKFTFTAHDQNPSHSIHGFVLEYSPQARR